ncbi:hypothetical protein J2Z76_002721 [Sedimentibacter acidaminivorans]|uniref:Uncharacterized protein n=1 Tax=Sedimentibacter acidaminivorans TaxID=913099 RepID=A0ABS4GGP4_9FIRM|nr:hypothetical protein [Sedimentibacter acidaminivorans]MBP1926851.1 hypothetical protein [Sedimentibacter acidaminivorans]
MIFKEQLAHDTETIFLNNNEFSEVHIIDGVPTNIIIDNDELKKRTKNEYNGIYFGDLLYFVDKRHFAKEPKIGETQIFDKRPCTVTDVKKSSTMYEIVLEYVRN